MAKRTVSSIDQKLYDYIHELLEQRSAEKRAEGGDPLSSVASARDLRISEIIEYAQGRDFQLRRTKRVILEKAVEKILKMVVEDEGEYFRPEPEKDEEEEDDEENMMVVKDSNALNKSVVSLWKEEDKGEKSDKDIKKEKETVKRPAEDTKGPRKKKSKIDHTPPQTSLSALGGLDKVTTQLMELVGLPILHPEIYLATGVEPSRGVLLYGPPGCGKTTIANALAGELQVPFISISAPSVVSGMSGESEKKLREIFDEARQIAPCIIFVDEIDAITPKRDGGAQREMERRIVAQMLTLMDELTLDKTDGKPVIVMGATNRPDSLDPALRRAGRFDREICLSVPNEEQRMQILQTMTNGLKLAEGEFDFRQLSKMTPGYVGADLKSLVTAAGIVAIKRIFESMEEQNYITEIQEDVEMEVEAVHENSMKAIGDLQSQFQEMQNKAAATSEKGNLQPDLHPNENKNVPSLGSTIQRFLAHHPDPLTDEQLAPLSITFDDFVQALPTVQPTAKREGFATVPDVSWQSVGALTNIRTELHMCIVQPIRKPELYLKVGISAPAGVLMWGPPGCGKTLLAKAVANESRANFISIKGPELLNKYVGESERAVRQVFQRARASVPCIIFFDELDALVPRRDSSLTESSSRVVNTLLTELDGLNDRKGVFVIGATNRPDMIDPAMLRPGRLDKTLYIELPTAAERVQILHTLVRANNTPLASDVDLEVVANNAKCRNFSGADLSSLVREAAVLALKRKFYHGQNISELDASGYYEEDGVDVEVTNQDFAGALDSIKPSVSDRDRARYERLNKRMGWSVIGEQSTVESGEPEKTNE